jgi:hypothetical protein
MVMVMVMVMVMGYLEGKCHSPADDLHYSRRLLEGVLRYSRM